MDGGLGAGDFACLADKFEWDANEDGALCIQYIDASNNVSTHRLTPKQWTTFTTTTDVGTEGQVADPELNTLLPAAPSGS